MPAMKPLACDVCMRTCGKVTLGIPGCSVCHGRKQKKTVSSNRVLSSFQYQLSSLSLEMDASVHILLAFLGLLLLVVGSLRAFPAGVITAGNSTNIMSQVEKEAKVIADPTCTASDMIYVSNQGDVGGGGKSQMCSGIKNGLCCMYIAMH